jgi:hypothetical protein
MNTTVAEGEVPISLFGFLCHRMKEIGIQSVHGVPGELPSLLAPPTELTISR